MRTFYLLLYKHCVVSCNAYKYHVLEQPCNNISFKNVRDGVFIFTFPNGERYQALFVAGTRNGDWDKMDPVPPLPQFSDY